MRAFKAILIILGVMLLLIDVSLRAFAWHHDAGSRALATQFKLETLHTNAASGIGIFYAKTEKPLWTEFDFTNSGNSRMESYYFHGHDVFDVTWTSNRPPKCSVFFRGPGKSVTWWLDRLGSGSFNERIFYDTNGDPTKHEVWYDDGWRLVDRRDGTNGLVIDRQWHPLAIDTNETWTIKPTTLNQ